MRNERIQGMSRLPTSCYYVLQEQNTGSPTGRESYGDRVPIGLCERESRLLGEGEQVTRYPCHEVREMRIAETVVNISRERGRPYRLRRFGLLESRVMRKYQARFGGGPLE